MAAPHFVPATSSGHMVDAAADGGCQGARPKEDPPRFHPSIMPFLAARELVDIARKDGTFSATRGQKSQRKKRKKSIAMPGARLEHLMCFYDNDRLTKELRESEDQCKLQEQDLSELNHLRSEEVLKLTFETQGFQQQFKVPEDLLDIDNGPVGCPELSSRPLLPEGTGPKAAKRLQALTTRCWLDMQRLQKQTTDRRAELEQLQEKASEAQREAAVAGAKLTICQEMHEHELKEFRQRLPTAAGGELERPRRHEADSKIRLAAHALCAQQARALLESERQLHREEVDLLMQELGALRASAGDGITQPLMSGSKATVVADALQLRQHCEALQSPVGDLLSSFQQLPLQPAPKTETALHTVMASVSSNGDVGFDRWVGALAGRVADLTARLAAAQAAEEGAN